MQTLKTVVLTLVVDENNYLSDTTCSYAELGCGELSVNSEECQTTNESESLSTIYENTEIDGNKTTQYDYVSLPDDDFGFGMKFNYGETKNDVRMGYREKRIMPNESKTYDKKCDIKLFNNLNSKS